MSLYSELSERREIMRNELTMLEKKLVGVKDEVEAKEKELDDINKVLVAWEKK